MASATRAAPRASTRPSTSPRYPSERAPRITSPRLACRIECSYAPHTHSNCSIAHYAIPCYYCFACTAKCTTTITTTTTMPMNNSTIFIHSSIHPIRQAICTTSTRETRSILRALHTAVRSGSQPARPYFAEEESNIVAHHGKRYNISDIQLLPVFHLYARRYGASVCASATAEFSRQTTYAGINKRG